MTTSYIPLDVAIQFTEAWTGHDLTTASEFVDAHVIFDGPLQHSVGAEPYLRGLRSLSDEIVGFNLIASFGDGHRAMLMYELKTRSYGMLTCAKLLTVRDGKIVEDKLAFDTHPIRSAAS